MRTTQVYGGGRRRRALLLACVWLWLWVGCVAAAAKKKEKYSGESFVVDLSDDNFDELTHSGLWIVKFYAPWCGHCKSLAPVFDEASAKLKGKVKFGKIDATSHKETASRFEVKGYPTLKYFNNGHAKDYKNTRTLDGFLDFGHRLIAPPVATLTKKGAKTWRENHEVGFVLFQDTQAEENAHAKEEFELLAKAYYDELSFATTTDAALLKENGGDAPVFGVWREGELLTYDGDWDEDRMRDWALDHRFILLPELASNIFKDLTHAGKPTVAAIVDTYADGNSQNEFKMAVRELARTRNHEFAFCWINGALWTQHIEQYGLKIEDTPLLLVFDGPSNAFAIQPPGMEIVAFLDRVRSGEIPLTQTWTDFMKTTGEKYGLYLGVGLLVLFFVAAVVMIVKVGDGSELPARPPLRDYRDKKTRVD